MMEKNTDIPISEYLGSPSQTAYAEPFLFDDGAARGMRGIRVSTGAGLTFTVLPDRGMDLYRAEFRGVTFVWISPCGPRAAQFLEHGDLAWLRNWGGGSWRHEIRPTQNNQSQGCFRIRPHKNEKSESENIP